MSIGSHPESGSLIATRGAFALAIALLLGAWVLPLNATPITSAQVSPTVSIRFEGFLKAIGPGKWLVGETSVLINDKTAVLEKRGRAEPGAWVIVWGARDDLGSTTAELIVVDRPAGWNGPVIQFSGVLRKQENSWWVIDDILVLMSSDVAQITGDPRVGSLLWVVAENQDTFFRALAIEVLAETPDTQPVEFEGEIEKLGQNFWIVDGRLLLLTSSSEILGEPMIGATAEVRAVPGANGTLIVLLAHVVDQASQADLNALVMAITEDANGAQTWELLVFPPEPWGNPARQSLHVTANTFVDESRAIARPGQWIEARGVRVGPDKYQADIIRLEQPVPVELTEDLRPIAGAAEVEAGSQWRQFRGQPVWLADSDAAEAATADTGGSLWGLRLGNGVIWVQQSQPSAANVP